MNSLLELDSWRSVSRWFSLRQTLNAVNLRSVLSSSGGFDCQFDRLSRLDSFCRHRIVSIRSSRARHAVSPLFFKSTRRFLTLLSAFFLSKPTVYFGLWCRVLDCRVRLICGSLCPARSFIFKAIAYVNEARLTGEPHLAPPRCTACLIMASDKQLSGDVLPVDSRGDSRSVYNWEEEQK